jgi:hypothetical protein
MPGNMMLARRIKDAVVPATTGKMGTYPTGTTASIEVDSSGSAGTAGNYTQIVPVNTIASEIRITSVVVAGFEGTTRYTFTLSYGATSGADLGTGGVELGTFSVHAGATADAFVIPVSMANIPAKSKISIKSSVQSGANQHCDVAINYVTV